MQGAGRPAAGWTGWSRWCTVLVGRRGGRDGAGGAQVPAARAASLCEADGNLCSARNGRSSDRRRLAQPLTTSPGRWLPPGARTHGESGETLVSLLALLQVSVLQHQGDRVVLGKGEVTALCMKQPFHPCVQVTVSVSGSYQGRWAGTHTQTDRRTLTHPLWGLLRAVTSCAGVFL